MEGALNRSKIKKWAVGTSAVLVCIMSFASPVVTHASGDISVTLDGKKISFDQPPVLVQNRTLVPLRAIFEAMGATVTWNNDTQTVTAVKGDVTINLTVGSSTAYKNGTSITLDVPAQVVNDRTLVPVRFISEAMGETVNWDDSSSTVVITSSAKGSASDGGQSTVGSASTGDLTTQQIGQFANRVVYIEVDDANGTAIGSGSGLVISGNGEILTNYHVIRGGTSAKVVFSDKTSYTTSTVTLADSANDLALLKIDATNLPAVNFGDSSTLQLGQSVVGIGSPLGLQNTLSTGVVSAPSRVLNGRSLIQTSVPIDHGSSGGALFNMKGEVVGVTSYGLDSQAQLNYAIPSNTVKTFLQGSRSGTLLGDIWKLGAANLQDYLNKNLGTQTFKGSNYHFTYRVGQGKTDPFSYSVSVILKDASEYMNLMQQEQTNYGMIAGLALNIGVEAFDQGAGNKPFVFIIYENDITDPSGYYPQEYQSNGNGTYHLDHTILTGGLNIDTNKFSFIYNPVNPSYTIHTINIF